MFRLDLEILDNSRADLHRFYLKEGEAITFGRKDCDLELAHPKVSRRHLRISILNGKPIAEDLGTERGSTLNGFPLNQAMQIHAGSALGVGPYLVRLLEFKKEEAEIIPFLEKVEEPPSRFNIPLVGVKGLSLFSFWPFLGAFVRDPSAFWRGVPAVSSDLFVRSAFRHAWVAVIIHFLVAASDGWILPGLLLLNQFLLRALGLLGIAFLLKWIFLPLMDVETSWEKAGGFVLTASALWFPLTVATAFIGAGPWAEGLSLILAGLAIWLFSFGVSRTFRPQPDRFWALTVLCLLCTATLALTAIRAEARGRQTAAIHANSK